MITYEVQQYKIWRGVDPNKPTWANLNLVYLVPIDAQDMVEYLERNNPDRVYRFVVNTN